MIPYRHSIVAAEVSQHLEMVCGKATKKPFRCETPRV
jgi:hypothetical protein